MTNNVKVRKAVIADARKIKELLSHYAGEGKLLDRSLLNIYENIRNFFVAECEGKVLGCCCLHICWEDLGEIRSLAVKEENKGKGIGKELVEECLEEAKHLGLKKVFTLTYVPDFFKKFSFENIGKEALPHKIWSDCINCPKFPDCDETALVKEI